MIDWPTFRDAPAERVREVCPRTVIVSGAGTRRDAMLQGVNPESPIAYFRWGLQAGHAMYERWFELGVQDLFICLIRSSQMRERGAYGDALLPLAVQLFSEQADAWAKAPPPFAVRTFGDSEFPSLGESLGRIQAVTARPGLPRVWWTFIATPTSPYDQALALIADRGVRTQAQARAAIYGPDVAPCQLYIAFGKPILTAELQLPFLIDEAQAMWYQSPGYSGLSEQVIRRMIYEQAYMRSTWVADKSERYQSVPQNRARWEQPQVLGFGQRLGDFWYPASDSLYEDPQ